MASFERPRRPASVIVLAVFHFIVGGIGLIYESLQVGVALWMMNSPAMVKAVAARDAMAGILTEAPLYFVANLTASLVGLVLSILLIADGVGLLLLRRWSYNLGVLYGWFSIIYQVAWLTYFILIPLPVVLAGASNMPVPPSAAANPQLFREGVRIGMIGGVAVTASGLAYPIFVLIMLAVTRKAFRRPKWAPEGTVEVADAAEGPPPGYGDLPPGYEMDDRIGPAPS